MNPGGIFMFLSALLLVNLQDKSGSCGIYTLFGRMPLAQTIIVPLELPNSSGSSTLACHTFKIVFKPGFRLANITYSDVVHLLNPGRWEVQM